MRPGDQLVLGASNPVRDIALVGFNTPGVKVRSNRGVAGIDGTVSTAIGAALAHERAGGGRTIALIGDLTFVHDSSGLLIGPTEPTPRDLTIVVSNDNGGGIFELLEQGDPRFSDVSSRIFGTPHDVDVGALCRAYHVESRQIEVGELADALDRTVRRACGCWRSRPTGRRCGRCTRRSRRHCETACVARLKALWRLHHSAPVRRAGRDARRPGRAAHPDRHRASRRAW